MVCPQPAVNQISHASSAAGHVSCGCWAGYPRFETSASGVVRRPRLLRAPGSRLCWSPLHPWGGRGTRLCGDVGTWGHGDSRGGGVRWPAGGELCRVQAALDSRCMTWGGLSNLPDP